METYGWHNGVKNHVLKVRARNPHYIGDASKEEDEIAETTQTQKTDWENILADNPLKETAGYKKPLRAAASGASEAERAEAGDVGAAAAAVAKNVRGPTL